MLTETEVADQERGSCRHAAAREGEIEGESRKNRGRMLTSGDRETESSWLAAIPLVAGRGSSDADGGAGLAGVRWSPCTRQPTTGPSAGARGRARDGGARSGRLALARRPASGETPITPPPSES
jgi:hypothetical protein